MLKKIREKVHEDSRGAIYDLLEDEMISAVSEVTFTVGAIRGNHIHKVTSQWNYIVYGKLKVVVQDTKNTSTETLSEGDIFLIPPGEAHAMQALTETRILVFTLGARAGKNFELDNFRLETPLIGKDE